MYVRLTHQKVNMHWRSLPHWNSSRADPHYLQKYEAHHLNTNTCKLPLNFTELQDRIFNDTILVTITTYSQAYSSEGFISDLPGNCDHYVNIVTYLGQPIRLKPLCLLLRFRGVRIDWKLKDNFPDALAVFYKTRHFRTSDRVIIVNPKLGLVHETKLQV